MLQETILRLKGLINLASPVVFCSHNHHFLVAEQMQQIDIDNPTILLEPNSRNTTTAITAAAMQVVKNNTHKNEISNKIKCSVENDIVRLEDIYGRTKL